MQDTQRSPRLIGYCRVSTDEQVRNGVSLQAQRARLEAYCLAHDVQLVRIATDDGVSGSVKPEKRTGLDRALKLIRGGRADGLVVLKLDRLSRTTRDVLDLVDESRRRKWTIAAVQEKLDTGSAAGRLVLTVLAALAEMERAQVSERTTAALHHIGMAGRPRSSILPFGWQRASGGHQIPKGETDREPMVENPAEQAQLSAIMGLAEKEGLGHRRIARRLDEWGMKNPRTGEPWTPGTVKKVVATARRRHESGVDTSSAWALHTSATNRRAI